MAEQAKTVFIFNPTANGGRSVRWLPLLQEEARAWTNPGVWRLTQGPDHARKLAREAALTGAERVVALGGDGTVNEVLNGLMQASPEQRPVLGVVPVGAGNDFAFAHGFPTDPVQALKRSLLGAPRFTDLVRVRDDRGREAIWGNTLGIGFDAVVNLRARRLRFLKGFWRYLVAVLQTLWFHHHPVSMRLVWDGEHAEEEEVLMLVLCNGPREGGAFLVAPEARPDDGLLHYARIPGVSRLTMLGLVPRVMKGTHVHHPQVRMGTFRRLHIQAQGPLYIHMDGEVFADFGAPARSLEVELLPRALRVAGEAETREHG